VEDGFSCILNALLSLIWTNTNSTFRGPTVEQQSVDETLETVPRALRCGKHAREAVPRPFMDMQFAGELGNLRGATPEVIAAPLSNLPRNPVVLTDVECGEEL